ncbi:hypothetical protein J6590_077241 [Homalodisca vitripennis]|nr:hypothetical protein J6590_077241 [Homalodisca vitripennis]
MALKLGTLTSILLTFQCPSGTPQCYSKIFPGALTIKPLTYIPGRALVGGVRYTLSFTDPHRKNPKEKSQVIEEATLPNGSDFFEWRPSSKNLKVHS